MLRVGAFALTAGVLYPLLKAYVPQLAPLLGLAASVGVALMLASAAADLAAWLGGLCAGLDTESFGCLLRAAGVLLCADYCRELCKDAQLGSLAVCVEFSGRVLGLYAALPLLKTACTLLLGLAG